jgi:hypothetical protein
MRHFYIAALLAVLPFCSEAQSFFGPAGATWQFGTSPQYYYYARVISTAAIGKDTISTINYYQYEQGHSPHYMQMITTYTSGDTVYCLSSMNKYIPLYIFNTKAGDTLKFYKTYVNSGSDPYFYVRIDSMKPMLWNGQMLRTVWGYTIGPAPTDPGWNSFRRADTPRGILYVERLGAIYADGLLPWTNAILPEDPGYASCYYDGTLNIRPDGLDSCAHIPEDVPETLLPEFSLYPNPAGHTCNIRLGKSLPAEASVIIYDVCGRKQMELSIPAGIGSRSFDLLSWPAGIYLVALKSGQYRHFQRLVKE